MLEIAENSTNDEWKCWCRLCAKENALSINLDPENQQAPTTTSTNLNNNRIIDFLEEFFRINIKDNGDLPQLLCIHCFNLVSKLAKFVDHVREVQSMYDTIRMTGEWKPMDLRTLRDKCVLHENDIYTLKTPEQVHSGCITKSAIEKVFVDDLSAAVKHNLLDTIVKNEFISDEVASGVLINNVQDSNDINEFEDDYNDDPFADDECYDSVNINKNLEVELIVEGEERKWLTNHSKNSRGKEDNDTESKTSKNSEREIIKKTRNRRVKDCKKRSRATGNVKKAKKPVEKNYHCVECSIDFQQDGNYRAHMKKKHGIIEEPLKCPECPKTFESINKLNRHTKIHRPAEEKKVYPCPQCDRKFQSKDYVAKHIKFVHEDVRAFICEECGEAVRTEATLREHMLRHTDYAPFVCETCNKGFKNPYRLKTHMEIHSCNKYICSECGLQLNSRVTLNRHMLVHSDVVRHKCEYCGRAFKRAKSLKSHLILHSGLKPYSCNFCEKTFANSANCRSHKRKAHPQELAALEAAGGITYTKNIPKLAVLKAVTRCAENLLPVVTKQSGNFSSGKRPKLLSNCPDDTKTSQIHKNVDMPAVGNEFSEKVLTVMSEQLASFKEKQLDANSLTTTTTLNNIPPTWW